LTNIGSVLIALILVDIILYFLLVEGYIRHRRIFRFPKVSSSKEAFAFFETAYKEAFPLDKNGFTWGEAIEKANRVAQLDDFEWGKVKKSLKEYEAYRYAGIGSGRFDTNPILRLAVSLREKVYSVTWWQKWRQRRERQQPQQRR
jgi:hypothetical protein